MLIKSYVYFVLRQEPFFKIKNRIFYRILNFLSYHHILLKINLDLIKKGYLTLVRNIF